MNTLLAEFARETWAMEPRALEAFLQTVARLDVKPPLATETVPWKQFCGLDHDKDGGNFNSKVAKPFVVNLTTRDGDVIERWSVSPGARMDGGPFDEAPRRSRLSVAEGVASIGISGVLLKRVPNIARWFGIEATSYGEIQSDLAQAMGDDNVKSVRLKIESPGGMVSGVKETADAIYQAATKKKIDAEIQDLGASAAYWLASQADTITANPNATVGSLGAYTAYADFSKAAEMEGIKVHVIASGPHKGMGVPGAPISEEQLAPIRRLIDGIASGFHADITRGRGMDKDATQKWMTGEVWRAEEAVTLGVIDAVKGSTTTERTSSGGPAAAETPHEEVEIMANDDKAAAEEKIRSEAGLAERKRLGELRAAFPGEEKFVMEQYEAGASVLQAEAAFSKVLRTRLAAKETELAAAKTAKPAATRTGAEPLAAGGDPQTQEEPDFVEAARAYAKEHECSLTEAMSRLSKGKPGQRNSAILEKHLQGCLAAAPNHAALKAANGLS